MTKNKKTLVIGGSPNPERVAFKAIEKLVAKGHSVIVFGKNEGEIADVKINTHVIPVENIDTVSLYINPTHQSEYYKYIIDLKPNRVLFSPGTENPEFYQLLKLNDIRYEEACTLVLLTLNEY
ncbi:CoA-binding protein [Flavobacterium aquiphilum]|uniref:CoA-binding protein n=1 Tax=Flavobacterium aquiphilum TaxID=3003261 RepID=UPI002480C55A|nr:CoA-binding protein [Flavobacterium aquiphilum]